MRTSFFPFALILAGCGADYEDPDAGDCTDGEDNDGDGWADCYDGDCYGSTDCEVPMDTDHHLDTGDSTPWDDTGWDDTGWHISTEINVVSYGFDTTVWEYEVELIGWGSGVDLDIYMNEAGHVWEESHVLDQREYDPNGTWDVWGITLPIVADWRDQVDSVNTFYEGSTVAEATMTWMVTAYDMDENFADCAVWGKRTEYYESYGCWEVVFQ
jgi:hypothetical protein